MLTAVHDPEVTDIIVSLIMRPALPSKIEEIMKNPLLDPKDYSYSWNKLLKPKFDFNLVRYQ